MISTVVWFSASHNQRIAGMGAANVVPTDDSGPALAHHWLRMTHQHNSRYKVEERRACGEAGSQGICRETVGDAEGWAGGML